jgi:hypothetical protein
MSSPMLFEFKPGATIASAKIIRLSLQFVEFKS